MKKSTTTSLIADLNDILEYVNFAQREARQAKDHAEDINEYTSIGDVVSNGEYAKCCADDALGNLEEAEDLLNTLISSLQEGEYDNGDEEDEAEIESRKKLLEIKEELLNLSIAVQNTMNKIEVGN